MLREAEDQTAQKDLMRLLLRTYGLKTFCTHRRPMMLLDICRRSLALLLGSRCHNGDDRQSLF